MRVIPGYKNLIIIIIISTQKPSFYDMPLSTVYMLNYILLTWKCYYIDV